MKREADDDGGLEWWAILLIVLFVVLFIVLIMYILCCCGGLASDNDEIVKFIDNMGHAGDDNHADACDEEEFSGELQFEGATLRKEGVGKEPLKPEIKEHLLKELGLIEKLV